MKTLDEITDIELSAGDMNQILGGSAYPDCIDANDIDDTEALL